jgi:hypothetical protein
LASACADNVEALAATVRLKQRPAFIMNYRRLTWCRPQRAAASMSAQVHPARTPSVGATGTQAPSAAFIRQWRYGLCTGTRAADELKKKINHCILSPKARARRVCCLRARGSEAGE